MGSRRRDHMHGQSLQLGWDEAEEPAAAQASAPEASTERRGARRAVLMGGGIVLVLALVVALPQLLLSGATAEQTAARYLQAVLDGDAETVREHLAPSDGVLDIALTDEVLAAAPERTDSFTLDQVTIEGDSAEVIASLLRGDYTLETTLHLDRERRGPLQRESWTLRPVTLPVLRLEVPVGSEHLVINGQDVQIPEEHRPEEAFGLSPLMLHVVPGTFEISAPQIGDHLAPAPELVDAPPVLGSRVSPPAQIGYELTEAGADQLLSELDASFEECLRSSSPRPTGCPFAAPQEVTGSGTGEPADDLEVIDTWGEGSIYSVRMTGAVTFTLDAAGDTEPQEHEVEIDASAFAVFDRDGNLTPEWNTRGVVIVDGDEGEAAPTEWYEGGGSPSCETAG